MIVVVKVRFGKSWRNKGGGFHRWGYLGTRRRTLYLRVGKRWERMGWDSQVKVGKRWRWERK